MADASLLDMLRRSGGLGGLGSILGSVLGDKQGGGLGGIGSLLDMDGDGNALDDIIGLGRKFIP